MFFSTKASLKPGNEVAENVFYFKENQMLDCNQYIIVDKETDELTLFDAGNGISLDGLIEGMEKVGMDFGNITKLFLTHEHVDHVLGLYKLKEKGLDDSIDIFAYGETATIINEGDEEQIFPGNLGIRPEMFGIEIEPIKTIDLKGKKEIKINNEFTFTLHYTPGHSLGSVCYYEPEKKILIPGDLVFTQGSFGRYDFPGGSLKQLQDSIQYVSNLDVKYLLPGHMGTSSNGNSQIQASNRMVHSIGNY